MQEIKCRWKVSSSSSAQNEIVFARVVHRDPEIHSGDLLFTGTRVPVDSLVGYLIEGRPIEDFLRDYPTVERWQVESYLDLAPDLQDP